MDPFARKMLLASLAFGGFMLLLAGALGAFYLHYHPPCSEQVFSEAGSPDGRWKAAVLERRCGESAPFLFHANIRGAGDPIRVGYFSGKTQEGEVLVVEEDTQAEAPTLDWTSPNRLTILCLRCRAAAVRKREEHWGTVTVRYQLQP